MIQPNLYERNEPVTSVSNAGRLDDLSKFTATDIVVGAQALGMKASEVLAELLEWASVDVNGEAAA